MCLHKRSVKEGDFFFFFSTTSLCWTKHEIGAQTSSKTVDVPHLLPEFFLFKFSASYMHAQVEKLNLWFIKEDLILKGNQTCSRHLLCKSKPSLFQGKALQKLFAALHTFPIQFLSIMDFSVLYVQFTTCVRGDFTFQTRNHIPQRNDPFQVASVCIVFSAQTEKEFVSGKSEQLYCFNYTCWLVHV